MHLLILNLKPISKHHFFLIQMNVTEETPALRCPNVITYLGDILTVDLEHRRDVK